MVNELYAAAKSRAVDLGYRLEEFWTGDPALANGRRLARVLRTRGIRGILWAPLPAPEARLDFAWDDFSSLVFSRSLVEPQLHVVVNHQYRTMRRILEEIRKLGYRRIGLWLSDEYDRRVDHNWSAGFWVDYHGRPKSEQVDPRIYRESEASRSDFAEWVKAEQPEVIVTGDWRVRDWLEKLHYRVPEDVGLCLISVSRDEAEISGTYENHAMAAYAGVNFLVDMLHRGEQGVPEIPQTILIDCIWLPGRTLLEKTPLIQGAR
jgi:LacI family transcriptional regulator